MKIRFVPIFEAVGLSTHDNGSLSCPTKVGIRRVGRRKPGSPLLSDTSTFDLAMTYVIYRKKITRRAYFLS